ncbi:hypothetical protein DFH08DRAFT_968619 [Mycena albidolilacea]|uniref:Uncharacterized protein n=1 Tax=Mycena albidolilacea TaxID=1033008 RepID=A0AAD7EII9_9AGAR|nr:hypothetical protein DFH08DRAFT_968619 [Mycena albidolilacea]
MSLGESYAVRFKSEPWFGYCEPASSGICDLTGLTRNVLDTLPSRRRRRRPPIAPTPASCLR